MLRSPSPLLFLSALLFLSGSGAYFLLEEEPESPLPRLPGPAAPPVEEPVSSKADVDLSGPWAKPAKRESPKTVIPVAPPAAPAPIPPPADSTSIRFLGMLTRDDNVKTYLFKNLTNGRALTLVEGQESQGWMLVQITPTQFSLTGPGGSYVVNR